jgi:hypothetical protein
MPIQRVDLIRIRSGFGQPIDLSIDSYQHLTGEVSFRLYGWNSAAGTGATYIRNLTGNDLVVFGEVLQLAETNDPTLVLETSNDWILVTADFAETATTNYVLQSCTNLISNGWSTASGVFSVDTNWSFAADQPAEYYRAITQ